MERKIGRVTATSTSQMTVLAEGDDEIRVGSIVKARVDSSYAVGTVATVEAPSGDAKRRVIGVDLLGEITAGSGGVPVFRRGIHRYPTIGAPVSTGDDTDAGSMYARPRASNISLGTQYDGAHAAYLLTDELLGKHFAIFGSTGSGKSCCVALILRGLLEQYANAHILVLDPHNEYGAAFQGVAELVGIDSLQLPLWLLDFEEACRILIRGGTSSEREAQAMILKDGIAWARRNHAANDAGAASITVDTPVPFSIFDLVRFINEEMGRLGKPEGAAPYLRLRSRIESLRNDHRFAFMFSHYTEDCLPELLRRLLRIPPDGKPLTIIDLSGIPSDVTDVVVSMISRILFDFAFWAERDRGLPVLLVCEEAQRYVPSDERVGFAATTRALSRIAKEGRKYGLSLALISQRPSELAGDVLSQCGTIIAMRLADERDQEFVAASLPDAPRGMLNALPTLPAQEAIICGQGVAVPQRVRLETLEPESRPGSTTPSFSDAWKQTDYSAAMVDSAVRRWRYRSGEGAP